MTNFSTIAERIGKTTSEKKAVEAMANALGSVENAITDGDTNYEGHCFIDDAEQYASEGLDSLDKRTLNHISDERISEFVGEIKSRIERVVTFIGESSYEREAYTYGWETVYIYKFADEDGNMLVWKTTSSLGYWDENDDWNVVDPGENIKLRGTVKQHNVYNGIKQTVLNRCIVKF